MSSKKVTIFIGLSGGVDSSVSAQRLITAGYTVIGVFIKTWVPDFLNCNIEAERLDAMRVAAHLQIPFYTLDAEEEYKRDVADYMIAEYREGRTPNPDVMCNKFVKFGAFLKYAQEVGGAKIATGHYAQVKESDGIYRLYRGVDSSKDQSYFLWTLTQKELEKTLFPIGDTLKADIRAEAKNYSLPTATKSDSQGICFLGHVDIKEFLSHYIEAKRGNVLDETDNRIGTHDGAIFYTIGQRQGFKLHIASETSSPHYVVSKDLTQNTITVSTSPKTVSGRQIMLTNLNKIATPFPHECDAQFRYRQKPFRVTLSKTESGRAMLTVLDSNVELPSVGQSCVLYQNDECLGGGTINAIL